MINSNVALDLKQVSGVPYWKARGADTWNPFKSTESGSNMVSQFLGSYSSNVISFTAEVGCIYLIVGGALARVDGITAMSGGNYIHHTHLWFKSGSGWFSAAGTYIIQATGTNVSVSFSAAWSMNLFKLYTRLGSSSSLTQPIPTGAQLLADGEVVHNWGWSPLNLTREVDSTKTSIVFELYSDIDLTNLWDTFSMSISQYNALKLGQNAAGGYQSCYLKTNTAMYILVSRNTNIQLQYTCSHTDMLGKFFRVYAI